MALAVCEPTRSIAVHQGAQEVSEDPQVALTAVLGSCVATCLHDPVAKIGGMNHFLLPELRPYASQNVLYGAQAMELLINAMLKRGARKDRLRAKLFGGARVLSELSDIGAANVAFALNFLREDEISLASGNVGGVQARRIRFHPATGEAYARGIEVPPPELNPRPKPLPQSSITLF